jgi:putative membrane protein
MPPVKTLGFAILALLSVVPRMGTSAPRAAALTDPQIASIAYTAGSLDIENARLALEKSHNPAIRSFAQDMIRDHTAFNRKLLALVGRLRITPQDNPMSQSLVRQADNVRDRLARLSGEAFDRAYIDNEAAYHRTVDSALKARLIPATRRPQLKRLLESGLKIGEDHERRAEEIAGRMG